MLVPYDFKSLYPSAQIDRNGTWPKRETAYRFKDYMNESIGSLFNRGSSSELSKVVF